MGRWPLRPAVLVPVQDKLFENTGVNGRETLPGKCSVIRYNQEHDGVDDHGTALRLLPLNAVAFSGSTKVPPRAFSKIRVPGRLIPRITGLPQAINSTLA